MTDYITIEGFKNLSQQEIFDISVSHVLKNGKPSMNIQGTKCCYSGIGCAAAPFIRKDKREATDEHGNLAWSDLYLANLVPEDNFNLINKLQTAHDYSANNCDFIVAFKQKVNHIATAYNLNTDALNK